MINVDIKFLKHIVLIMRMLLEVTEGKYNKTPGMRQHKINVASRVVKQLNHLIKEGESEEAMAYIHRGIIKAATWK